MKIPLEVRCKGCSFILFYTVDSKEFEKFDPYKLPRTCPNCGRNLDPIMKAEFEIYPIRNNNSKGRLQKPKIVYYKLYPQNYFKLLLRGRNRCYYCGKSFKIGETIVSERNYRHRFHLECFDKIKDSEITVIPWKVLEFTSRR
jgi:hypothetical protein